MIYLDSSALVKLIREEVESAALDEWLEEQGTASLVSSDLATVEVLRTCRRFDPRTLPAARDLLARLDSVPLSRAVVADAGEIEGPLLRSPDALHLASALSIATELTAFVSYDERLTSAAATHGLRCVTPGRDGARS